MDLGTPTDRDPMPPRLDLALRWAAGRHDGQRRKASDVPYVQHPVAVAWILDRLGYDEDVVIAALLHDVVEDTGTSLDEVRDRFGDRVAALVGHCTERKLDAEGRPRPWIDRKRDHLIALESAPAEARAIVLADALHNLRSILADLRDGRPVWGRFNADRERVLGHSRAKVDRLGGGDDPGIRCLAGWYRSVLDRIEAAGGAGA